MATTTTARGGIKTLSVNGVLYDVAGDCKYSAASLKRESLAGEDRVHGYKETPQAPFIECSLRDGGGLQVGAFNNMTNVTVTVGLRNGKTVIGSGMWTVTPEEVETQDAKFTVRWEGVDNSVIEA